ncbi:MAG: hypothetical protein BJ554DRAFT_754 [Olpidium bornovanus]|uniref:Uncharacterized protein n=1 Tax=Olpidium bornovanus TaxID=278681 RepID=A0A8H8A1D8_9FUNG|nr:MAG: hypothetical protein BJ554DRAFT_754 [Olpidium bornovanus]
MKMAPRWHFDPSIGIGRPCTSLRFSTCTILRDMIKEFDDDNDAGGSTPGVKFGVRPTVDDASGNPTGMGFAIRRQFRPELLHFRIDAAVLANVKSSVEIPPVGTDMAAPPVALASDKQRVEIVLSFMSQPIALRFGDLTDELNWRVADINYILS